MSGHPPLCRKCFGTLDNGNCYECAALDCQPDADRTTLLSLTLFFTIIYYNIILIAILIACAVLVQGREYYSKLLIPESLMKYYNSELTSKAYLGKQNDDFLENKSVGRIMNKRNITLYNNRIAAMNALLFPLLMNGVQLEGHRSEQRDDKNMSEDRIMNAKNITSCDDRIAAMDELMCENRDDEDMFLPNFGQIRENKKKIILNPFVPSVPKKGTVDFT